MDWDYYLKYDESSPSYLRWKVSIRTGKGYNVEVISPGDVAGAVNGRGYFDVGLDNASYKASRIIWEMLKGPIPEGKLVDHIDRDRTNNRICNLRLVTDAVNSRNSGMSRNNTSGVNGVSFRRRVRHQKIEECWSATWKDLSGKQRSKNFSVAAYGDRAFDLACKARKEAISKLNTEGAGYTQDHGLSTKEK